MHYKFKWLVLLSGAILLLNTIWHLEYIDYKGSSLVMIGVLTAIPLVILICHQLHCLLRLLLFLLYIPLLFVGLVSGMCAWIEKGDRYVSKSCKRIVLTERSYDCGALDSSPSYQLFKEIRLTEHLKYVIEFEDEHIDTAGWSSLQ